MNQISRFCTYTTKITFICPIWELGAKTTQWHGFTLKDGGNCVVLNSHANADSQIPNLQNRKMETQVHYNKNTLCTEKRKRSLLGSSYLKGSYHTSATSSPEHCVGASEAASLNPFCCSGRERPKMGKKASAMLNYLRSLTKSDCSQQCLNFSFGSEYKL